MALLTDERGFITEGTGNNYFIVKDGEYASNPVVLHTLFMLPRHIDVDPHAIRCSAI